MSKFYKMFVFLFYLVLTSLLLLFSRYEVYAEGQQEEINIGQGGYKNNGTNI